MSAAAAGWRRHCPRLFWCCSLSPALIFTDSIALFAPDAVMWIDDTIREGIPTPPVQIRALPLIGPSLHDAWVSLSRHGSALNMRFEPEIRAGVNWILLETGILGTFVLEFALAILIAGIAHEAGAYRDTAQ
jgi:hypothetical protein